MHALANEASSAPKPSSAHYGGEGLSRPDHERAVGRRLADVVGGIESRVEERLDQVGHGDEAAVVEAVGVGVGNAIGQRQRRALENDDRVTPVARSFVSIPAGVFETPFRRYNVLTLIGNSIWCLVLAAIGWALGSSWDTFHHDFRWVEYLVVVAIIGCVAYVIWRIRRPGTLSPGEDSPR